MVKKKTFFKVLKINRRKRNWSPNLKNQEQKEKLVTKILEIERRKRNFSQVLKIKRRRRNFYSNSWKLRGERDVKIHFLRSREKNRGHFSSMISRDRDSCQCATGVGGAVSILEPRCRLHMGLLPMSGSVGCTNCVKNNFYVLSHFLMKVQNSLCFLGTWETRFSDVWALSECWWSVVFSGLQQTIVGNSWQ